MTMRYEGTVYRPPSESNSLLIQATIGCPHNRCTFCGMYRTKKFRIRPVAEIKEDLKIAHNRYGKGVESIFFPDGNTIFMKTDHLADILDYATSLFPHLSRMTMYGSTKYLKLKTLSELQRLRSAGLTRIHSGLESGDEIVLAKIQKGFTAAEMIENGLIVKESGIELSEYILIGIGGTERSHEHAVQSAEVLNAVSPDFIRLRTYNPIPGTPLYEEYLNGEFHLLGPHAAIRETSLLIEGLQGPGQLFSDHVSNYAKINGNLPEKKVAMLTVLNQLLNISEDSFNQIDPYNM
jgi:radical SAM superfamily enzyme YgiQ (UPF0313 family)